jgi:hypothetical protein
MSVTDEEYYAELRLVAQTLRAAGQQAAGHLTPVVRDQTPEWLIERLEAALRAIEAAAGAVGRFIREDLMGSVAEPPPWYGSEDTE